MNNYLQIVIFSASSFVVLFLIAKALGKKQIAELNFIDYVVGISIGSIAAEMATELEKDIWVYLIAMGMFFVLDFAVSFAGIRFNFMKKLLKGTPTTVIENGEFLYKNLRKTKLDVNEIVGLARSKGFFDISNIAFAIFETNGELSILPKSNQRPVVLEDLEKSEEPAHILYHLVVDGRISKFGLKCIQKDPKWLVEKLCKGDKKQLKQILLASYDEQKDEFDIYPKTK